jgi:hypothetical protein
MAQPQFEAHEVFQAIEMEKTTIFVVVEGMEVDVFDNVLRGLLNMKSSQDIGWIVVSGADKGTILNFFRTGKIRNAYAIVDHDFTGEVESIDRVSYLSRYSIENFLFDDLVVRQTSARLYRKSVSQVNVNTTNLFQHYQENLEQLLFVLRAYQTAEHERAVAWSEYAILAKDCWRVDESIIENLLRDISDDYPDALTHGVLSGAVLSEFPGKLLAKGVYHYLRKTIKPPGFTKVFNNEKAFMHALFGNLEYSSEFVSCLSGVKDFLLSSMAASKSE